MGVLAGVIAGSRPSEAQYTGSFQTNVIDGVFSNWSGSFYVIGESTVSDALIIQGGGVLSNSSSCLGCLTGADSNSVVVSDNGSTWINASAVYIGENGSGNQMIVTNGGTVYSNYGVVGGDMGFGRGSNNIAAISSTGSIWSNSSFVYVGSLTGGNQMIISGGGSVYDSSGVVGWLGSNNTVVVSGRNSAWYNTGSITVGYGTAAANQLIVTNGGAVYGSDGVIGFNGGNNAVLVTGSGSVLGCASDFYVSQATSTPNLGTNNQLTVADGAMVYDQNGQVGGNLSYSCGVVLVTGTGSVWSNSADLYIGGYAMGSRLTVTNGSVVCDYTATVQAFGSQVLVGGNGATWRNQGNLYVGVSSSGSGSVNVGTGGSVVASNVYVSSSYSVDSVNSITVSGGALIVTNALGTGVVDVGGSLSGSGALLTLNSGTVTADSFVDTEVLGGFVFNGGMLSTKASTIGLMVGFPGVAVGNGTNVAVFNLSSGGTGFHSFVNGVTISSNALLNGIGTVIGQTIVNPGGMLSPGDGPGSITFSNSLTLAAGSTLGLALNGAGEGQYSRIIGLGGTISVSNAVLSITLGYTPLPGDTFTIISNLTSTAILGTFVSTSGAALPNGADFVVDNTTLQIDYAANADGMDVVLTALIPEPSSLLLTLTGALLLRAFVKRKRA